MSLPLSKDDALKVIQRRRGKIKITCVFCDRRIGWLDLLSIESILNRYGLAICPECQPQYLEWIRAGLLDNKIENNKISTKTSKENIIEGVHYAVRKHSG